MWNIIAMISYLNLFDFSDGNAEYFSSRYSNLHLSSILGFFDKHSLMFKKKKVFILNLIFGIINVFTVTFNQFNTFNTLL